MKIQTVEIDARLSWQIAAGNGEPLMVPTVLVTPEIVEAAKTKLVSAESELACLRGQAQLLLAQSSGERSWKKNGGHRAANAEYAAENKVKALKLLAAGKNRDGTYGWITPNEAAKILV